MDLPLRCARLRHSFLLGQSFAHSFAQGQITREVHGVYPRQEWGNAFGFRRHCSISFD
jgi:hypothetical protein